VYAFEPESANYSLLVRNVELNEYRNIVTVNRALSNQTGSSTLFLTSLDNGRHSVYRHDLPLAGSVLIETTTLDTFLESQGWPTVNLVKLDVEGAETDVLEGMKQLLEKSKDLTLILEFNPSLLRNAGVDPLEFLDRPTQWGFQVHWIDEKNGPLPIESVDRDSMVGKLLSDESSVNLWCRRP